MAEKRGETVKIEYDFNTAGALEIFMNGSWRRVTANDFRSFNGRRRISEPEYVELGNVDVPIITYDYFGPVYQYRTNTIVEYTNSGSIETNEIYDKRIRISKQRG